jgi:hypothetical protein
VSIIDIICLVSDIVISRKIFTMRAEPAAVPLTPCNGPLEVWRIGDELVIIGPGPVVFSMSRDAGLETSRRLLKALTCSDGDARA